MDDIANTTEAGQATLTAETVQTGGAQNAGSQPKGVGGGDISGIVATVANLIEGGYGEREAARRANQYAQDQMILSNQLTTDLQNKAAAHQLNYFNATAKYNSPEEQVKRLKQAGLNPALAYGSAAGAGGSGQTGSAPSGQTSAVGAQKANAAGAKAASTDAAIGMASLIADIELKKSQARKNNVEADYTEGVETKEAEARVSLIGVEADMAGVKADGMRILNRIARVDERIAEATEAARIGIVENEFERIVVQVQILDEELAKATRENKIGDAQANALMQTADAELRRIVVDTAYKAAQTYATKEGVQISKDQVREKVFENNLLSDKFDWERGNYGRELKGGIISQAWQLGAHITDTGTAVSDVRAGREKESRRPYGMGDRK